MKSYIVKYKYKDDDFIRTAYVNAVGVNMAKNKVERWHNFKIIIVECYEGD